MQNDQNLTSTPTTNQLVSQPVLGSKSQLLNNFRSNLFNGASASSDQPATPQPTQPQSITSAPSQPQQVPDQNMTPDLDLLDEVISEVETQSVDPLSSQSQSQSPSLTQVPATDSVLATTQAPTRTPPSPDSAPTPAPAQSQPQPQPQQISSSPQPLSEQPSLPATPAPPTSPTQPVPTQPSQALPQDSSILSQALPLAVTQVADQQAYQNLNPPSPTPAGLTGKEKIELKTPDSVAVDATSGIQVVEQEPNPELPPEVDGFLKKAEDHHQQNLQEIVIADGSSDVTSQKKYPTQPVVVLPITEETENKAKFKGPSYSIKWLVEWSHKMIKKFVGKIIYRQLE